MTRDEAKKRLEIQLICANCPEDKRCYDSYLHTLCENYDYREKAPIEEAIKVAIEALGQEPCGDAISRQAMLDGIAEWIVDGYADSEADCSHISSLVTHLPPVTLQPKTGHWIETAEEYYKAINEKGGGVNENTPYFTYDIACSECLAKFSVIDNETERFKCCPNCGAKMEVEG